MVTYGDVAKSITNIRWRLKENEGKEPHGVIDFECAGTPVTITEPSDVILDDNDLSRKWIADNYGWLLMMGGCDVKHVEA